MRKGINFFSLSISMSQRDIIKIIVSWDVVFDKSATRDRKDKQVVDSTPYQFGEPSPSPAVPSEIHNIELDPAFTTTNEEESDSESPPRRRCSLREIYD